MTELRAMYGGLELGLGAFFPAAVFRRELAVNEAGNAEADEHRREVGRYVRPASGARDGPI